jgi:iron(III) transport system permease protein
VNAELVSTLRDTVIFIGGSLTVALGLGLPVAWLLERTNVPARRVLTVLLFAPLLIPPVSNAQIWVSLLAEQQGVLNRLLRLVLPFESGPFDTTSAPGIVLAQGVSYVPLVTLFLGTAFRNVDASLEEASIMSGAGTLTTVRRVTFKLVTPAVLSTVLLLGVILLGQFEIPLVFSAGKGLRPVGLTLFNALSPASELPKYGQIAAYSMLVTAVSFSLIILYGRMTRSSERYATLTGKGQRARVIAIGRWRWVALSYVLAVLFLAVGLRLFVLAWQSVMPFVGQVSLDELRRLASLDAYGRVLGDPAYWRSTRLTAGVAISSAVVTTLVASAAAWVVIRHRGRRGSRAVLDLLASSSLGVPAPVAGFAFLVLFLALNRQVPLYGTVAALVIAYSFRIGLSFRMGSAAMVQIGRELEEASTMSGASSGVTFRRVIVPLLAPTVAFLFVLQLVAAIHEFTVPLFVRSVGDQPLSIYTYEQITGQHPANAAAAGMLTIAAVLVVAAVAAAVAARVRPTAGP